MLFEDGEIWSHVLYPPCLTNCLDLKGQAVHLNSVKMERPPVPAERIFALIPEYSLLLLTNQYLHSITVLTETLEY